MSGSGPPFSPENDPFGGSAIPPSNVPSPEGGPPSATPQPSGQPQNPSAQPSYPQPQSAQPPIPQPQGTQAPPQSTAPAVAQGGGSGTFILPERVLDPTKTPPQRGRLGTEHMALALSIGLFCGFFLGRSTTRTREVPVFPEPTVEPISNERVIVENLDVQSTPSGAFFATARVANLSDETISNLRIEIQLIRLRNDGSEELVGTLGFSDDSSEPGESRVVSFVSGDRFDARWSEAFVLVNDEPVGSVFIGPLATDQPDDES